MTRTGMPSERSLVIASEGVKPSPPAITRSAPAATTLSPAPSANRISVVAGVSETIFWGVALIVTAVPSSSVRDAGKAGATDGLGVASGVGLATAAALGDVEVVAAPEHAARIRTTAATRAGSRPGGAARVGDEKDGNTGTSGAGWTRRGHDESQTPRFDTRRRRGLIGRS